MDEFKLPNLPNEAFEILPRQEYFDDLEKRLSKVGDGDMVALLTMAFHPTTPQIQRLLTSLESAAKRGARVRLGIDAFAFLVEDEDLKIVHPGPLFFHKSLPRKTSALFQVKLDALTKLTKAGVDCVLLNMPRRAFTFPFAGRSHIKLTLINDRAYIGGCNLSTETSDAMVAFDTPRSATWLWEWADKILGHKNSGQAFEYKDTAQDVDTTTQLLFDAGQKNQSQIFDTALQLIDSAQEWVTLAYQFFPNGPTLERLSRAARRGVKVTVFTNDSNRLAFPMNLGQGLIKLLSRLTLSKAITFTTVPSSRPFLHAKILATEQAAMIGSHNYVKAGVSLGTAELALLRQDPEFSKKLVATFKDSL